MKRLVGANTSRTIVMSQITTHILDTARGCPAEGVKVTLSRATGDAFNDLAHGITGDDGRITDLVDTPVVLEAGTYRIRFEVSGYFRNRGHKQFYPYVDVVFNVDGDGRRHHIPLLLSPYAYSTYLDS
jgi:5-hydroxyisourate hydrolase